MAKFSLTSIQRFVSGFGKQPFWIGVDVHKRSYYIALRRSDGQTVTWVFPSDSDKLVTQLSQLAINIAVVAYEAGPTGFSLARALTRSNIPVIVAAASRIPRAVTPGAKCDRLDCIKLADYAAKGMLKPISIPTEQEEAQRSLIRRRHNLVSSVRRCKQRIKSMLLFLGVEEPLEVTNWSKKAPQALQQLTLEHAAQLTMESYLRELEFYQTELRTVEAQLSEYAVETKADKKIRALQTVPGVGPIVATSFAMEIYRPERFRRAEEVASYLGLAPVVRHSGGKNPSGRIVPAGQNKLRCLLVEAAWIWKSKEPFAAELYNRLVSKTGVAQKAIIAVARKLAIILWRLLIEERPYRKASMAQ